MPNAVRLRRGLATKPKKVRRAFIEPDPVAKWLAPIILSQYTDRPQTAADVGTHKLPK